MELIKRVGGKEKIDRLTSPWKENGFWLNFEGENLFRGFISFLFFAQTWLFWPSSVHSLNGDKLRPSHACGWRYYLRLHKKLWSYKNWASLQKAKSRDAAFSTLIFLCPVVVISRANLLCGRMLAVQTRFFAIIFKPTTRKIVPAHFSGAIWQEEENIECTKTKTGARVGFFLFPNNIGHMLYGS